MRRDKKVEKKIIKKKNVKLTIAQQGRRDEAKQNKKTVENEKRHRTPLFFLFLSSSFSLPFPFTWSFLFPRIYPSKRAKKNRKYPSQRRPRVSNLGLN